MSRQLKFRGRRIDSGEWVYGGYHRHITRQISPIGDKLKEEDVKHLIIQSGFADWNMPRPLNAIEVIPETIGQYTGLKDDEGKEIYEGDIIKVKQKYHEREDVGKVYFDEFTWFGAQDYLTYVNEFCSIEIIGTIYDE